MPNQHIIMYLISPMQFIEFPALDSCQFHRVFTSTPTKFRIQSFSSAPSSI
jgi:hypothetical protein